MRLLHYLSVLARPAHNTALPSFQTQGGVAVLTYLGQAHVGTRHPQTPRALSLSGEVVLRYRGVSHRLERRNDDGGRR